MVALIPAFLLVLAAFKARCGSAFDFVDSTRKAQWSPSAKLIKFKNNNSRIGLISRAGCGRPVDFQSTIDRDQIQIRSNRDNRRMSSRRLSCDICQSNAEVDPNETHAPARFRIGHIHFHRRRIYLVLYAGGRAPARSLAVLGAVTERATETSRRALVGQRLQRLFRAGLCFPPPRTARKRATPIDKIPPQERSRRSRWRRGARQRSRRRLSPRWWRLGQGPSPSRRFWGRSARGATASWRSGARTATAATFAR